MKKCPRCGKEYQEAITLCPSDGAVLFSTEDALIGQTLAGKYRVEELINQGGMGAVYRSTHVLMDKTVAIKVLHPALAADEKIVARFSREARAASRISHPHALSVTDFGESENGVVFLVMEYLHGVTLKEAIRSGGPMALPRVVEIIRQVSGALDAAHAEGVVHRDLKSDNIMLVDVGDGDWAKVLDFGIAKIQEPMGQDPRLTAPNLIIGTPQYMSPEQCSQAADIDSRSDLYSLGVILFEMLVGHVPFTGDSATAIMMKHLQDPPPSVLEEREDVPASVGRVVKRALEKRPEDRYQTVGEMADDLALAAGEEAPTAAAVPDALDRSTNRIVVPTDPNMASRATTEAQGGETTLVRKRPLPPSVAKRTPASVQPPPPENFNPWRIALMGLVGLLVIFAVVFALTRTSRQPSTNEQVSPVQADPNNQPVKPAPPATGQSEQGIVSKTPASPGLNLNSTAGSNQNRAARAGGDANLDAAGKTVAPDDNAADDTEARPSPPPRDRNSNQASKNANQARQPPAAKSTPSSESNANEAEPAAAPTPRKQPSPPKSSAPKEPPAPATAGTPEP
jgi:serine/threonine protein kinase